MEKIVFFGNFYTQVERKLFGGGQLPLNIWGGGGGRNQKGPHGGGGGGCGGGGLYGASPLDIRRLRGFGATVVVVLKI